MLKKKFLLLHSNPMFVYTLSEIEHNDNVVIYHKKRISSNRFINCLFNIHNSGKIEKYVELPFKSIWDKFLFNRFLKNYIPDYIIFTISWNSDHLLQYFREKCKGSKIIFRFSDTIANGLGANFWFEIENIRRQYDGVLVYNQEDADKFGFTYHSVGYSVINKELLKPCKNYDVVFIGAEKGRMEKIREAYNIFVSAGLSCFFYVTLVKQEDRKDDGIIYADKGMSFLDYLSYEIAAKCLFELVQDGSSGRTFRMMEAIMYNKLLVTNCTEIFNTTFYNPKYVQMFNNVSEIDASFVVNCPNDIDYNYNGEFSPINELEFIEKMW